MTMISPRSKHTVQALRFALFTNHGGRRWGFRALSTYTRAHTFNLLHRLIQTMARVDVKQYTTKQLIKNENCHNDFKI